MALDFSAYQQGIERIARQQPAMPRDRVILNRLFFFLVKELDGVYNHLLADHKLNSSSFLALAMLLSSEDNRLNPSDLSEALIASRTNVTRMTDELVNAGWIERRQSSADRRRIDLSLTEVGHEKILGILPEVWAVIEEEWSDFTAQEVVEFERLLRKLLTGIERCRSPR